MADTRLNDENPYGTLNGTEQVYVVNSTGTVEGKTSTQAIANLAAPASPSGRLTLVSATPVLNSDQTAKTAIYYSPYIGNTIPLYNGVATIGYAFGELTLNLDTTNHVSGSLYDIFIWRNAGVISIGSGPAWSSTSARGTGAGTTELQMNNGLWTNKNSITLKNGAGSGTTGIAANLALYVGTFYATANGQTGMAFKPAAASGGTANILGLYNAYNRVGVKAISRDSMGGTDYSYTSSTWRAANNNNNNRISWVDGLQQSSIEVINSANVYSTGSGSVQGVIGISLDSTTAAPEATGAGGIYTTVTPVVQITVPDSFSPQIGFHYAQRMEAAAAGTVFFAGSSTSPARQSNSFLLSLEM